MTNQEILEKAIKKTKYIPECINFIPFERLKIECREYRVEYSMIIRPDEIKPLIECSVCGIIFNHAFAKTLGYKLEDLGAWCDKEKEPLKYLEKFL